MLCFWHNSDLKNTSFFPPVCILPIVTLLSVPIDVNEFPSDGGGFYLHVKVQIALCSGRCWLCRSINVSFPNGTITFFFHSPRIPIILPLLINVSLYLLSQH